MMLHVANHGPRRRGEVVALLTGFGHSPGNLDLMLHLRATGRPVQAKPTGMRRI